MTGIVVVSLLLTQCANFGGAGGGGRSARLQALGFEPVPLQKITQDERFSGVFGINGVNMRLLIDSGANSTDISQEFARQASLRPDPNYAVVSRGALGRPVKSSLGTGSLQIGSVVAEDFLFTIGPPVTRRTATSRYAGQMGLDAMVASSTLVDVPRGRLWVPGDRRMTQSNGRPRPLGTQAGLGKDIVRLYPAGRFPHLLVDTTVQGRKMTWVVDTGAEVSVMARAAFRNTGLPSVATSSRMIDAAGDRVTVRSATLYDVRVGRTRTGRFDLIVAPLDSVRSVFKDSNGRPVDGILGMDFLTQAQALLDPASKLLYLGL